MYNVVICGDKGRLLLRNHAKRSESEKGVMKMTYRRGMIRHRSPGE